MGGTFSTVGDNIITVGDNIIAVGDNITTVELAQYSGDKDLKYYEFSKNLKIFSKLISLQNQIGHITGLNC